MEKPTNSDSDPVPNSGASSELQLVPETLLRRKHDMDEMKAHRAAQEILNPRGNRKVFSEKTKVVHIRKPETILAHAISRRNHAIRHKRVLRKGMQTRASDKKETKMRVCEAEDAEDDDDDRREVRVTTNSVGAGMIFCIRIRDGRGVPKEVKRILDRFRLKNVNEGVFIRYDNSARKLLHLAEAWIAYGSPSRSIVSDLLRRRGHLKLDGKRVPLSDNTLVEKALGDATDGAVICVQDLEHELLNVGEYFAKTNSSLWPFQLTSPGSRFQRLKLNYRDGGDYGDRGQEIADLIKQML